MWKVLGRSLAVVGLLGASVSAAPLRMRLPEPAAAQASPRDIGHPESEARRGRWAPAASCPEGNAMTLASSSVPAGKAADRIKLGVQPTRVDLNPSANAEGTDSLSARLQALPPDHELYLVLKDIRAQEQPGILYHIYLNLPPDASPASANLHHVAALNFFNAVAPSRLPELSFPLASVLQALHAGNRLGGGAAVTIVPVIPKDASAEQTAARIARASPTIGEIDLVEQCRPA